jgi:hypothetical protein
VVIYVCGIRIRFPVILSVTAILRSKTQGEMNNGLYQQICEHDAKFNHGLTHSQYKTLGSTAKYLIVSKKKY